MVLHSAGEKCKVYCRVGLALPVSTKISQELYFVNGNVTADLKGELKNYFSVGYSAAAGANLKISSRFGLYGEVSFLSMSLDIKEADYQSSIVTGLNPSQSVTLPNATIYVKNGTYSNGGAIFRAYAQPFSNIGFSFGLSYSLYQAK